MLGGRDAYRWTDPQPKAANPGEASAACCKKCLREGLGMAKPGSTAYQNGSCTIRLPSSILGEPWTARTDCHQNDPLASNGHRERK